MRLPILAGLCAALLLAAPAAAEQPLQCTNHDDLVAFLATHYDEHPTAVGLVSDGRVIEVLTSRAGTFTILIVTPENIACPVAAGDPWQRLSPPLAGLQS